MKLVVETLNEASGIRKDEWDLLNRVLGELTKSSTNRKLVKEFSNFIITTYDKQDKSRQRTWDLIRAKRQDNPDYGRPEREWRKDKKKEKDMKLIKESVTLSSKGKRALKESMQSKKLNETFAGVDVIEDLEDRAKGYIDDGYEVEEAINQAIDDGLIYTKDIIDLAEHYGVIDTSELFNNFYEYLFNDMHADLIEYESDEEDEEDGEVVEEALTEGFDAKSIADFIRNSTEQLKNGEQGLFRYKLDDKFALYVGWSAGYGNEKRDDVIQDPNDLDWGVNAGIKVHTSDYMQTDFDFLNYPYYENGDVLDNGVSIGYNENYEQLASYFEKEYNELKTMNIEDDGKIIEDKPLQEVMVDIDEDDLLDLLMNRLKRWTDDPVATRLYEEMYQSYIDSGWDLGGNSVMVIVDNDWVNYCDVVGPGEENYDALLKLYQENGLGDVSVEDVGYSFIEAATEDNGTTYLLCRW